MKHVQIERDFALLVAAAVAGERCPQNYPFGPIKSISALVKAGMIRTEIYALNWRVAQILDGPHAGKRTKEPPMGGEPYLINGVATQLLRARASRKIAP